MREIKFRAWIVEAGVMAMPMDDPMRFIHLVDALKFSTMGDPPLHLMQFTGLCDKNGREIYEGDIVHWYINDSVSVGIVHWVKDGAGFDMKNLNDDYHVCNDWYRGKYEVIGNIYENSEVLS